MSEKEIWKRTGKTIQELSFNKGGVITLAEEKSKNKTRLVPISCITIPKNEEN